MEQGIERPMSDLEPVFSMPVLPKILCTVPEEAPAAAMAPRAKAGKPHGAADASAALDARRQAEELRRVLRSMYKDHFQMQTEVRCVFTSVLKFLLKHCKPEEMPALPKPTAHPR